MSVSEETRVGRVVFVLHGSVPQFNSLVIKGDSLYEFGREIGTVLSHQSLGVAGYMVRFLRSSRRPQ